MMKKSILSLVGGAILCLLLVLYNYAFIYYFLEDSGYECF